MPPHSKTYPANSQSCLGVVSSCTGLCSAELEVFREVLGEKATVERTEHILEGARRCVYRVDKT